MFKPARTFADAFDPKNNAFGFLRLVLAALVVFSHSFPLGGFGVDRVEALTEGRYTIGLVSVGMFFVLSGFLVCRSACQTSVPRFLWHRWLRIFPGYWMCLIVCACIVAPFFALAEHSTFFGVFSAPRNSPQDFVVGNAALFHFGEFSIPGIFCSSSTTIAGLLEHNPFPYMINGSLWSLSFEVACYLALASLTALGIIRRARSIMLALFVGLWGLCTFWNVNLALFLRAYPYPGLSLLVMLSLYFFGGCLCFLYREKIPCSLLALISFVLLTALSVGAGVFGIVAPVTMTYALLWIAFRLPIKRVEAKGDFSYGLYIYAFPVQQGLALLGLQKMGLSVYFLSSLLLALALAILSYRLVEAPSLLLKNINLSVLPISRAMARAGYGSASEPVAIEKT